MDRRFRAELDELLVNTFRAIRAIEETMLSDLSNENLSISEMPIIEAIGAAEREPGPHGQGRTITEIAQTQSKSLPSATVAVKKLERKGYVYKSRGRDDARRIYVRLTPLGQRADTSHRYFHRQMVNAVARAMPQADRDAMMDGLKALNTFFQAKAEELSGCGHADTPAGKQALRG